MAKRQVMKMPLAAKSAETDNIVAFAEHVGRLAGNLHARAEGLLDPGVVGGGALQKQVKRVRDAAARLIEQLAHAKARAQKESRPDPRGRSGGTVDAPGKKHRKAPQRAKAPSRSARSPKRNVAREISRGRRS